jgi:hypothetical protein
MKGDSMTQTTAKRLSKRSAKIVHISFSDRELQLLQKISVQNGMKETDTVRELIRAEARGRGMWPERLDAAQP